MKTTEVSSVTKNAREKSIKLFNQYFGEESSHKRPMSVTINKSPTEVYAALSNLNNFPLFLENLEKVEVSTKGRANWQFSGKNQGEKPFVLDMGIEFNETESGLLWQAKDSFGFSYSIAIFLEQAQAGRGTVVRMMVGYEDKTGEFASLVEKIFGGDAQMSSTKNLQRFKAFCETGHVPTIEGQSSGRDEDLIATKH